MTHDVFICYADPDTPVARAVCDRLETGGIRCWIAPRDIYPGESYGAAIDAAVKSARVFVLVLSSHANGSTTVAREVEHAVSRSVRVLALRIEDVAPPAALGALIAPVEQVDALTPPLDLHLARLTSVVKRLLESPLPPPIFLHKPGSAH
ncbi:MAG: toll/interleukin-1 receptor domain-containing protein [Gemmatimonadota bacterium]